MMKIRPENLETQDVPRFDTDRVQTKQQKVLANKLNLVEKNERQKLESSDQCRLLEWIGDVVGRFLNRECV